MAIIIRTRRAIVPPTQSVSEAVAFAEDERLAAVGSSSNPSDPDAPPDFGALTSIRSEGFGSYANVAAIEASSQWEIASGQAGNFELITGYGGTGQALRFNYGTAAQSGPGIFLLLGTTRAHIYVRVRFRISEGFAWTGGTADGFKGFEYFRTPSNRRWTAGAGSGSNADGPPGYLQTGNEWGVHDNSWQDFSQPDYNPFCQNVSKSHKFDACADGEWHELIDEVRNENGYGMRRWIDGNLVLSTFDGAPGVPSGGFQCSTNGIYRIGFGDIMASGAPEAWDWDLDDIQVSRP